MVFFNIWFGLQMANPEINWLIFRNYIISRSGLTVLQVRNIWPDDPTGGTDIVLKFLIRSRLARCDQTNSSRPDGRISGHSWEYLARSCLDEFGDDLIRRIAICLEVPCPRGVGGKRVIMH